MDTNGTLQLKNFWLQGIFMFNDFNFGYGLDNTTLFCCLHLPFFLPCHTTLGFPPLFMTPLNLPRAAAPLYLDLLPLILRFCTSRGGVSLTVRENWNAMFWGVGMGLPTTRKDYYGSRVFFLRSLSLLCVLIGLGPIDTHGSGWHQRSTEHMGGQ